ncbi:hypothetical protein Clacol_008240 [Clathrus columnatus]|uniref:Uncharacterized protein n=1 Tax=Clathrus columnatus TaxID=1419009 RepID=A0AAV5AKG1_9AGAM|nr:hypothetical protein Clacol_008240 [Clathrus columnatus]
MPTSNPVSSVPVSNASQSKSLRSRLGFGGNNNNNNKSSFFTQLNLKTNRRSFTMHPGDNQTQDQTVLFIDPSSGNGNDAPRSATLQNSVRTNFSSLSKATTLHSRIPQRKSVPSSPILYPPSSYSLNLNSRIDLQTPVTTSLPIPLSNAQANINPNDSATSKQLPNLSNDLSLLLNEPAPPDASLSLKSSRESVIHIELTPAKEPFSVHRNSEEPNSLRSVPLSIGMSMETGNTQPDNSGINDSFDLSKARISLGSAKEGLKERWSRGITKQEISLSNADTIRTAVDISDASLYRSGPITSTPFVNRKATASQESSFDLDNLDPDLITLLRPNNFQRPLNHIPTPSEVRLSKSSSRPGPNIFDKLDLDELGSPPVSPSRSTHHIDNSDTKRLSKTFILPSPESLVRSGHSPQFQASALSYAPKPTVALNRIPWLDSPESEGGQMSSGPSTVSSSNLGTPSDISKPPTPLVSFQQSDQRRPEPFVVNESSAWRRRNQNGNTRASPHSMLPLPIEPPSSPSQFQAYVDIRPPSEFRQNELNNEIEKPRRNLRHQAIDGLRSEGRPSSVNSSHSLRMRGNSNAGFAEGNGRGAFESRRCRKRSMSVDQTPDLLRLHRTSSETTRSYGSEHTHNVTNGQNFYDERNPDGHHGQRDVGRDRVGGLSPEWLGPKTVKAFAAAGLLDQTRNSSRHLPHTRSVSEYKTSSSALNNRYRIFSNGFASTENERDRESSSRPSGTRLGAATYNVNSLSRPLSRADSWSNSRHVPSLARTISDVTSRRESIDGRDSLGSYPRTTSGYSITGGTRSESTGSGGRLSPTTTTTNSHIAVQSQFQILKDKYDSQTEALLAALADSQKVCRDLRTENGALKGQIKELEERLVETIATVKQKEKELARARRLYASDRSRPTNGKPNDNVQPSLSRPVPMPNTVRSISPPKARRFSNGSSVFPTIPMSMAMLMAENPGRISVSPPRESSGPSTSPPPSPTLVLPKPGLESKNTLNAPDSCVTSSPIPISHRRSTSVTSVSTSANFSLKSGSPGSLKLKPEHEFLLSDLTQISLITALGTDSEAER